ncbi:TonB-dependent receptor [Saccharophagus degradans]|uniref:TonB-dependent receptor n=1 Tax=Saccharophagus degradans TaxID=86304 RepID=UPI001C08F25C|nr:TonB-dependent receptor [Saccharophagus degradans]MBU2986047.1 TonB-dependent receptor [Saccharophagus degradans]
MDYNIFKKTQLAAAVSMVVGAATISPVYAQDNAADNTLEEVIVTGIRGSLQRAMDIKRDAQGVVDSISAEDIGKMPDTNLAESLQRITGVSIDRSNGEGQKITARGLGPDFNLVTLNGRQMPTSGLQGTSINSSRSFDFSNLASESVAGVDVYKTSRADIPTGGIGATVNIKTARPLDNAGFKLTAGVKGVYDTSREDASLTPEISALISNTFLDDTVGVSLAISHQEREGASDAATVGSYHTQSVVPGDGWNGGFVGEGADAYPSTAQLSRPQNFEYNFTDFERTRDNAQLVLQFSPSEDITATLDYTYSEQEVLSSSNMVGAWFWEGNGLNATNNEFVEGSAGQYYPELYSSTACCDLTFSAARFGQVNENNSVGVNIEWDATDNLSLELDYHNSKAHSEAASPYGNSSVLTMANQNRVATVVDFRQDFPVWDVTLAEDTTDAPSTFTVTGSSLRNSQFTNDISQVQLKGSYTFDEGVVKSVDFGVSSTENDVKAVMMTAQRDTWGGEGTVDDIPDSLFTAESITGRMDSVSGTGTLADGSEFNIYDRYYSFSFEEAAAAVAAFAAPTDESGTSPNIWPCVGEFCVTEDWTTDERVSESMLAGYVQANMEFEVAGMETKVTAGVRYEETDVSASAMVPAYSGVDWVSANEFALVSSGDSAYTDFKGSYSNFLPNIDVSLAPVEDVIVRASFSKTIARPTYNHIKGGVSINEVRATYATASSGDPSLLPHESKNFDLSAEWYFGDASYVSAGAFYKDVENFIGTHTETENFFGLRNPADGARFAEALASEGADNVAIRQYIFDNFPESTTESSGLIHSIDSDNLIEFDVSKPFNEKKANITGMEFAVQHTLDNGFGALLNFTVVDSDAKYDATVFDEQFALPGLSNTRNLVAFYDKDGLQVRVAWNWRGAFLVATDVGHGNPLQNEEYQQVDINASYDINDNFTVFAEGINVTNETQRLYGRYKTTMMQAVEGGPRYNIGARYTF